jgi:hypothetical protein
MRLGYLGAPNATSEPSGTSKVDITNLLDLTLKGLTKDIGARGFERLSLRIFTGHGAQQSKLGFGRSTQHQYKKGSELPTAMLSVDLYCLATHSALRFPATSSRSLPSKSGSDV